MINRVSLIPDYLISISGTYSSGSLWLGRLCITYGLVLSTKEYLYWILKAANTYQLGLHEL